MAIFGEISSITHSFEVKKGTVTEWNSSSSSSNGNPTNTNLLENLDTYDKVTEYQKKYTVTNDTPNPNPDNPKQDASFSLPASSIGLKVGILLKF